MNWILDNLQVLMGIAAMIAYFLNRSRKSADDSPPNKAHREQESPEAAERTRRVQEEIRRKIESRRAATGEGRPGTTIRDRLPPLVPPTEVRPIDSFGGPVRRMLKELEERAEQQSQPRFDPAAAERAAALERQQKLAEQMRALEAARLAELRRAEELAALRKARTPTPVLRATVGNLRSDLRDPRALRRAIVLREVLGPPVATR